MHPPPPPPGAAGEVSPSPILPSPSPQSQEPRPIANLAKRQILKFFAFLSFILALIPATSGVTSRPLAQLSSALAPQYGMYGIDGSRASLLAYEQAN